MTTAPSDLSSVWDWDFMWGTFGFLLKLAAPFVMIIIAIFAVGFLLKMIVDAIRSRNS